MNTLFSHYFLLISSFVFLFGTTSCDSQKKDCPENAICNDQLQTTETGLKYIHHIHYTNTRKPEYNEIMTLHYLLLTDKGDTITDTYKLNEPVGQPFLGPAYKGAIEEGFRMMNVGDSATFYVILDSLKDEDLPFSPKMRERVKEIRYITKLYNTQSQAAFDIDEAARAKKRVQEEVIIQDKKIVQYMKEEALFEDSKKHPSGLYYKIIEEGKGIPAQIGDSVSFTFQTWTIPNQQILDGSKKDETLGFVIGSKQIIPAWQIAFTQFAKKGSKMLLFTPSHLAFGDKKHQGISGFTMLRFEIEVVDIVRKDEMSKLGNGK